MKCFKSFSSGILLVALIGLFSCVNESTSTLEKEPYFDLKGFIEEEIEKLDSMEVSKVSQIQREEKQTDVVYSIQDWEEELGIFKEADINKSSLLQSYETKSSGEMLSHKLLPKEKGDVKYIKVTYSQDEVSSVSIEISEQNLFYTSTTLAELHMSKTGNMIDHYSIEKTQKIWFLDENRMKIMGTLVPKH